MRNILLAVYFVATAASLAALRPWRQSALNAGYRFAFALAWPVSSLVCYVFLLLRGEDVFLGLQALATVEAIATPGSGLKLVPHDPNAPEECPHVCEECEPCTHDCAQCSPVGAAAGAPSNDDLTPPDPPDPLAVEADGRPVWLRCLHRDASGRCLALATWTELVDDPWPEWCAHHARDGSTCVGPMTRAAFERGGRPSPEARNV